MLTSHSWDNDDGDVNDNGKKAISLDWLNNNFARASRFFVTFFAVIARLRHESAILWRVKTQHSDFLFLFLNYDTVLRRTQRDGKSENME